MRLLQASVLVPSVIICVTIMLLVAVTQTVLHVVIAALMFLLQKSATVSL